MRGVLPHGEQIRTNRLAKGLTQRELAELANLDIKTVRKAEQCHRLDPASVTRLASVLGIDQAQLLQPASENSDAHYEVFLQWRKTFIEQNESELVKLYHPQGVLLIAGGPDIPFGGVHQGREQIGLANVTNWKEVKQDPPELDDCTFLIGEDTIMVRGDCKVHLANGEFVTFPSVMVFTFQDRLIIKHEVQFDTLEFAKTMPALLRD